MEVLVIGICILRQQQSQITTIEKGQRTKV